MRSAPVPSPKRPKLLPAGLLRLVSDERLVEQFRAGSDRAFEVLFDRHHGSLLAFCRHMLGSREEAEDVVQHTFLAAYCHVRGSDKPITARPWLFTIARNRCVSILRAQRELTADKVRLVAENLAVELDRREDLRSLLADVARLPEDQRAALVLTELRGVPQQEIGTILGCRQERVKALVFQARASLAADRVARETPCYEIRSQLATLRGAGLRRAVLRRHLRGCVGCREFQAKVRLERRQLGALLPGGPGLGLTAGLPGALTGSGAAGLGGVTLKAGALGSGLVARVLVGAALTGGGAVAGVAPIAHGGPATTSSPAVSAAKADADAQSAAGVPDPDRGPAAADDRAAPRLAGGAVAHEEEDIQHGLRTPVTVAAGSLPEQAYSQDRPPEPERPAAATVTEVSEPSGQPAAEPPAEPAQEPHEQASSMPPSSPADPDGPGEGPAAGRGESPPHAPARQGPPPRAGGQPASDPPPRPPRAGPPATVPHDDRPGPPPGLPDPQGRPEPPNHSRAEAAAAYAEPHAGGPAKPAARPAPDGAAPAGAKPASPPGPGSSPSGSG